MVDAKPTVLLSGINRGANLAEDITYSGTAAAAMEGALLGVRSIALSQVFAHGGEAHWETTARRSRARDPQRIAPATGSRAVSSTSTFPIVRAEARVIGIQVTTQVATPAGFSSVRCVASTNAIFPTTGSNAKLAYETGALEAGTDLAADCGERRFR